ncbi:hypothetical protein CEB3_c17940 [Peptococcaceae bacterium CEB3]|nr:hypothetical protein CEB3_c17940 [Peptococcaceae bacterium CEB3]
MAVDVRELPEVLRVSVEKTLEAGPSRRLVFVKKLVTTDYVDKLFIETVHKAYIDCGAFFVVLYVADCPNASWNQPEKVETSSMGLSEILTFVEHTETLRDLVRAKLRETEQS